MSTALDDATVDSEESQKCGPIALNRTCKGCQRRKIKCVIPLQNRSQNTQKCTRCAKLSLDCVFPPPAIKKTRKRNEARLKELEQRFETIQKAIESQSTDFLSPNLAFGRLVRDDEASASTTNENSSSPGTSSNTDIAGYREGTREFATAGSFDPFSSGLVSYYFAENLYKTFSNDIAPLYPLVLAPRQSSWQETREKRPALFLSILAVASAGKDRWLSEVLFTEAEKLVTEKVAAEGEKSLDLVQALLVLSTWYLPFKKFQNLKFSQYAQMAATMVLELRFSNDEQYAVPSPSESFVETETLREICRTFLACYFLCSSIAISFRRPTVLRYSSWVEDCIKLLDVSPLADIHDRRLVAWSRLQRIAERNLTAVGLDDGFTVDFSDGRTRLILNGCLKEVEIWRELLADDIVNEPMEMHYQMIIISLNEPSLYEGHNLSDFRPPYKIRSQPLFKKAFADDPSEAAASLFCCINSAQKLLQSFLQLSTEALLWVPVVTYTRMTYALVVLIKICVSLQLSRGLDSLMPKSSPNPKLFLARLIERLDSAAGQQRFQVPAVFGFSLRQMLKWYDDNLENQFQDNDNDVIEPMLNLNISASTSNTTDRDPAPKATKGCTATGESTSDVLYSTDQFQHLRSCNNPDTAFVDSGLSKTLLEEHMLEFWDMLPDIDFSN